MIGFLDIIDKYKFGIVAAFATYLFLFVYSQLPTITYSLPPIPDALLADMDIPESEVELQMENMQIDPSTITKVTNAVRDANDGRERSDKYWTDQKSLSEVEKSVYDLEKEMYEQAGGAAERERIRQEAEKRKESEANKTPTNTNNQNTNGGNNAPKGNVLVEWSLKDRIPHLNNKMYIRIPGYMCDSDARGQVTVRISVNQNGDVVSAKFDPSLSTSSNYCMVQTAEEFAMKSRFAYSANAPKLQNGTITYVYVPQ